jgi:hypothetical protein
MAKNDVEKLTEEKVAKGGLLVRLYFDMQNKEKDKLQPLMLDLVNERLMKERGVIYVYGSIEEPIEREGSFITSGIITVLLENFQTLLNIAFKYAPAGVEILKPSKELHFKVNELQSMVMDISQIAVDYSKYILEKAMKPEDIAQLQKNLEQRAEIGRKLAEKARQNEEDAKKKSS